MSLIGLHTVRMAETAFRFATSEDEAGVLGISGDIYGGMDSLGEVYPALMDDPTFHAVVGESGGEVVAFGGAFVRLEGRKLVSYAARVREDCRGKGLYKQLTAFLRNRLKERAYPGLVQEEFFTPAGNPALKSLLNSKTYRPLFVKGCRLYKLVSSSPSFKLQNAPRLGIRSERIGLAGLKVILSDPGTYKRVFPDRVLVGSTMYDPCLSEFPMMETQCPDVVASSGGGTGFDVVSTGARHRKDLYMIYFHFDENAVSPTTFVEHLVLHMEEYLRTRVSNGFCCMFAPGDYLSQIVPLINITGFEQMVGPNKAAIYGFCRDI